ncbi:hypothetical protein TL16_g08690 [Triparma laevis f. inornata]|uniref:Uncharacterized protein n=1 Tax=Triparma laevis f. inornata TaxID=1714386 RepID=A0A9W7EJ16_9STRA|nr:hypothetical protein TL16_g08690 [Triparma laevis f. inornata]
MGRFRLGIYNTTDQIQRLQHFNGNDEPEPKPALPLTGLKFSFLNDLGSEQTEAYISFLVKVSGGDFVSFGELTNSTFGDVDLVLTDCLIHPPHVAMSDPYVVDGMKKVNAHGVLCCDLSWLKSTILKGKQEDDFGAFAVPGNTRRAEVKTASRGYVEIGDCVSIGGLGEKVYGRITKLTDDKKCSLRALEWHDQSKCLIDKGDLGMKLDGIALEKMVGEVVLLTSSEFKEVSEGWRLPEDGGGVIYRVKRKN